MMLGTFSDELEVVTMLYLRLAIAKYRLFFGFCPKCNSDAPAIDSCNVCNSERSYPPSKHKKQTWFNTYKQELENEQA